MGTRHRRRADELRARHRDDRLRVSRRLLLSRRHRRSHSLPRHPDAIARPHQSRQPRPGPRRARPVAAGREPAHRPQARLRLAARAVGRGDGFPAHCARGAPRGKFAMTVALALEVALGAVVLGVAVWTIAAREPYAASVGFVAYGLLLALIWVRLDAVDVALTEAAISGSLGGVLLLGAAARLRAAGTAAAERPGVGVRVLAAGFAAAAAAPPPARGPPPPPPPPRPPPPPAPPPPP